MNSSQEIKRVAGSLPSVADLPDFSLSDSTTSLRKSRSDSTIHRALEILKEESSKHSLLDLDNSDLKLKVERTAEPEPGVLPDNKSPRVRHKRIIDTSEPVLGEWKKQAAERPKTSIKGHTSDPNPKRKLTLDIMIPDFGPNPSAERRTSSMTLKSESILKGKVSRKPTPKLEINLAKVHNCSSSDPLKAERDRSIIVVTPRSDSLSDRMESVFSLSEGYINPNEFVLLTDDRKIKKYNRNLENYLLETWKRAPKPSLFDSIDNSIKAFIAVFLDVYFYDTKASIEKGVAKEVDLTNEIFEKLQQMGIPAMGIIQRLKILSEILNSYLKSQKEKVWTSFCSHLHLELIKLIKGSEKSVHKPGRNLKLFLSDYIEITNWKPEKKGEKHETELLKRLLFMPLGDSQESIKIMSILHDYAFASMEVSNPIYINTKKHVRELLPDSYLMSIISSVKHRWSLNLNYWDEHPTIERHPMENVSCHQIGRSWRPHDSGDIIFSRIWINGDLFYDANAIENTSPPSGPVPKTSPRKMHTDAIARTTKISNQKLSPSNKLAAVHFNSEGNHPEKLKQASPRRIKELPPKIYSVNPILHSNLELFATLFAQYVNRAMPTEREYNLSTLLIAAAHDQSCEIRAKAKLGEWHQFLSLTTNDAWGLADEYFRLLFKRLYEAPYYVSYESGIDLHKDISDQMGSSGARHMQVTQIKKMKIGLRESPTEERTVTDLVRLSVAWQLQPTAEGLKGELWIAGYTLLQEGMDFWVDIRSILTNPAVIPPNTMKGTTCYTFIPPKKSP